MNTFAPGKFLGIMLLAGFFLRMGFAFYAGEPERADYWEYGIIAQNLLDGQGYSFYYFEDDDYRIAFNSDEEAIPSAYMPPGYVIFLVPFFLIENEWLRNLSILFFQNILAILGIFFLFQLSRQLFSEKTAHLAAAIASFLPAFIFASNSFGPTAIYHFLIPLFFYLIIKKPAQPLIFFPVIGLLAGAIILLRAEFALFIIFLVGYWSWKLSWHKVLLFLLGAWLVLAPWQVRNYLVFEEFVPITTNSGLNLHRGHNSIGHGTWGQYNEVLSSVPEEYRNHKLEPYLNEKFRSKATAFIVEHPGETVINSLEKFFIFWTIDPADERSTHALYWLPWMVLLLTFIYSLYATSWREVSKEHLLFFAHFVVVAVIFFVLPRYQVLMKIMVIPYAALGLLLIWEKISARASESS